MRIGHYLKQNATLEKKTGTDQWGASTYSAATTIKVRKTQKAKWSRHPKDVALVSVTRILTDQQIALGDRIDGEEIAAVESLVDFDGSYVGCLAFPRAPMGFTP